MSKTLSIWILSAGSLRAAEIDTVILPAIPYWRRTSATGAAALLGARISWMAESTSCVFFGSPDCRDALIIPKGAPLSADQVARLCLDEGGGLHWAGVPEGIRFLGWIANG